jgi:nitrite reductase (NO-forming)
VHLADMRIDPARIAVPAGTHLLLRVTNIDEMRHDLYIRGGPRTPLLRTDQSATLDLGTVGHDLQGWCTVPGHKAAGMTMSIIVDDAPPSTHDAMAAMPGMAASDPSTTPWSTPNTAPMASLSPTNRKE